MNKRKAGIIAVVAIAVVLIVGGSIVAANSNSGTFEVTISTDAVADYDRKVEIWGTVPGNSSRSKLDDMNIDSQNESPAFASEMFSKAISNTSYYWDAELAIDTYTYLDEIAPGYEKSTYEDEPYLIPYLVSDSPGAVIVIPGGGYGCVTIDGATSEGKDIAEALNRAGFSAFVLHYRSNPYEYPIPQLDVQRAVRYLRYHANDYGFDPDNIGLIGFSAGGNQVGCYINLVMGNNLFPANYVTDEIDAVDDTISAPAMIYPALSFNDNVPMLFSLFDDEQVKDDASRQEILQAMDLKWHLNTNVKNQFVSYGTNDSVVGMDETRAYIFFARLNGINVKIGRAHV